MKKIISGIMIVVWLATLVGGCNQTSRPSSSQETAVAQFELESAKVRVTHFAYDSQQGSFQVNMQLAWSGGEVTKNVAAFTAQRLNGAWNGASVSLRDERGKLLWEYFIDWDINDTTWIRIQERTDRDALSIKEIQTPIRPPRNTSSMECGRISLVRSICRKVCQTPSPRRCPRPIRVYWRS